MTPGPLSLQTLEKKMGQADAILRIAQRTAACHDGSLFLDDITSAIGSAIDHIIECRELCSLHELNQ
ncbi:hypothetical protein D3C87_1834280 [compost metagenome]